MTLMLTILAADLLELPVKRKAHELEITAQINIKKALSCAFIF